MFVNKNVTDEFSGNKAFSNSYFYKLPLKIRIIEGCEKFKAQLE